MPAAGPLSGILVVDLTRVLAGPFCTMLLADLGARVIKVEAPGTGDDARRIGPFVERPVRLLPLAQPRQGEPRARPPQRPRPGLFERLLARADVLAENFRPGVMQRLGYGWEDARAARYPRLVMASISGFGQTGPYAQRPAYDVIAQAMGGDHEPDRAIRARARRGSARRRATSRPACSPRSGSWRRSPRASAAAGALASTSRCSTRRWRRSRTRSCATSRAARCPARSARGIPRSPPSRRWRPATASSWSRPGTTRSSQSCVGPWSDPSSRRRRSSPATSCARARPTPWRGGSRQRSPRTARPSGSKSWEPRGSPAAP